jgi:hypothetical protein
MTAISRLFRRRPDAVISFPKSGRTWLRVMLDELGVPLEYTHAGGEHKTALHFERLDTSAAGRFNRIVFLHRDPRDTAVSGYYQVDRRLSGYDGTISGFIRDPCHGIEKVIRYNRLWLDLAARRPNMLALAYEEMRADPHAALARVLTFLGRPNDDGRIAVAVSNNTFARMQEREKAGAFDPVYEKRFGAKDPEDPESLKVRRGKVGGYADELSPEDIAWCDGLLKQSAGTPA